MATLGQSMDVRAGGRSWLTPPGRSPPDDPPRRMPDLVYPLWAGATRAVRPHAVLKPARPQAAPSPAPPRWRPRPARGRARRRSSSTSAHLTRCWRRPRSRSRSSLARKPRAARGVGHRQRDRIDVGAAGQRGDDVHALLRRVALGELDHQQHDGEQGGEAWSRRSRLNGLLTATSCLRGRARWPARRGSARGKRAVTAPIAAIGSHAAASSGRLITAISTSTRANITSHASRMPAASAWPSPAPRRGCCGRS